LAAIVQAMVELTSPTTMTKSGLWARQTFSNSTMTRAVCSAWEPEPHLEIEVGLRHAEIDEERLAHPLVVVLTGMNEKRMKTVGTFSHRFDDGRHLHEIGPRTHHVDHL
jgi:hypothetical protein